MVKIQYSFENLPQGTLAAFNAFSYRKAHLAVQWTNKVNILGGTETGTSGYLQWSSTGCKFLINTNKRLNSLTMQFTDNSTESQLMVMGLRRWYNINRTKSNIYLH